MPETVFYLQNRRIEILPQFMEVGSPKGCFAKTDSLRKRPARRASMY
jgi:hypothetical protein